MKHRIITKFPHFLKDGLAEQQYVINLGMQAYIISPTKIVKTAAFFVNFQIITIF